MRESKGIRDDDDGRIRLVRRLGQHQQRDQTEQAKDRTVFLDPRRSRSVINVHAIPVSIVVIEAFKLAAAFTRTEVLAFLGDNRRENGSSVNV